MSAAIMTIDVAALRARAQPLRPSMGLITRARLWKAGRPNVERLAAWLDVEAPETHAALVTRVEKACR